MENDPHALRAAVKAAAGPDARAQVSQVLVNWIEGEREARIIVTRGAEVLWASAAAEALLRPEAPLFITAGVLKFHAPAACRRLDEFLGRVDIARAQILEEAGTVLWGRRISGDREALGLTIRIVGEPLDFTALGDSRNLTRAERRVLEMILAGGDTADIADRLRISIQTARSHVKRAYRKLGVTSRGELFVKALPFLQP